MICPFLTGYAPYFLPVVTGISFLEMADHTLSGTIDEGKLQKDTGKRVLLCVMPGKR
jgi:hypothetical protein